MKKPKAFVHIALLTAAAGLSGACGTDPLAPPVPVAPSPFSAQVGGQWTGTSNIISVGGVLGGNTECVGQDVFARIQSGLIPNDSVALALTQTDATVAGRLTSSGSGLSCSYTGSTALTGVVLDADTCAATAVQVRCNDETVKELAIIGSTVIGSVSGRTMVGTVTNTYNVNRDGKNDGSLILKYAYSLNKQP